METLCVRRDLEQWATLIDLTEKGVGLGIEAGYSYAQKIPIITHTENMQIRIRKAKRTDSDELTRIAHAAKRFWGYPERLIRLWRSDLTITPEFVADHPVYCATLGSRVVGFCAVSGEKTTRELEHLWVDPDHIGSGVGRLLLSHLLGDLRRQRVTRLTIASDPNAEGFYRKCGARRVGTVPSRPAGRHLPLLVIRLRASGRTTCR